MEDYDLYNYQNKQVVLSMQSAINGDSLSYIDDGNLNMDKEVGKQYLKGNQELTIESVFIGDDPVREIIKTYLLEKQRNSINISIQKTECNNTNKNIIVASPKEVC